MLVVGLPPSIVGGVRSPVECRRHDVVAALGVRPIVAARLHDVNLSRLGPRAVGILDGQHPDGRPQPVSLGKLCSDLDTAVLDSGALLGVDAS